MFKLNEEIKIKSGQLLTPFLVDGQTVYCFDRSKRTVQKKLVDFDFLSQDTKSKIQSIIPVRPTRVPTYQVRLSENEKVINEITKETIAVPEEKKPFPEIIEPVYTEMVIKEEPGKVIVEKVPIIRNTEEEPEIQYSDSTINREKEGSNEKNTGYGTVINTNIKDEDYI